MAGGRDFSEDRVVKYGLGIAVVVGVVVGLVLRNWALGAVGGVVAGLALAWALRSYLGSTALDGVDRGQRKLIGRALRRGEAVTDPALAPQLIATGEAVLGIRKVSPKTMWTFTWCVFGLGALILFGWLAKVDGATQYAPFGFILAGGGVALLVTVPLAERSRRKIRQAIQRTRDSQKPLESDDPSGL
jgi:hypothetical protein